MSGFLHQLAARSLGLAPAIQPRAALPYAAPAPETPAPDLTAVAPEAPAVVAAAPLSATWRNASGTTPETATVPPTERHATAVPTLVNHSSTDRADIPALPSLVSTVSTPRQHPDTTREGEPTAIRHLDHAPLPTDAAIPSARQLENQAAADSPPASDAPAAGLVDLEALIGRLVGQATARHPLGPDGTPSASPAVTPANAQPPRPGHTSHRPAEHREALAAASRPADTAPEVHITIGRLEVNPPSRPTPPPPRPRGPAPLSLGDYLARRAGGRS